MPDPAQFDGGALFDAAPCGLLLVTPEGDILRANRTLCRWLGLAPPALAGRRFPDLLSVGGRLFHQTHIAPLLQVQRSVAEVKLELLVGDGGRVPVVVNIAREGDGSDAVDHIAVFIAQDRHAYERELMVARRGAEDAVARLQQVQEQLLLADRRKDEFLAMLAHELRNPLAPISSAARLIVMAADDAGQVRAMGGIVGRQVAHLAHLVDDLLDVSRVTRGMVELQRAPLDLSDVLRSAVEQARPLIDAHGHALRWDAAPGLHVDGDASRLVQVVVNLLNNAAKYTPPGGTIELRLAGGDDDVLLEVADDGQGIDAALLPHVFDLFSQGARTPERGHGGLGIGLALVRSLVEMHGGRVAADSDGAGQGSRFRVWLPRSDGPAARPDTGQPPDAGHGLSLLVVDDNVDAARTLAAMLEALGHHAQVAHDGAQALALSQASHRRFDACILDIGLPDMSGHELAARLRAIPHVAGAVLLALTGYGQACDQARSQAAGFAHHLVKPVDLARLAGILQTLARVGPGAA